MNFNILRSGSAGNCTLICSNDTKILIDIGDGPINTKRKLAEFDTTLEQISGVLITHEHIDHIKSINLIDPKLIYATKKTLKEIKGFNIIKPFNLFKIGCINICPIPISHDCNDGLGYIIDDGKQRLVYMTDTGIIKEEYLKLMENADYYILEANHDVEMLYQTNRPMMLIDRILSDYGHLSNEQCGQYLSKLIGPNTKTVILAHVSGQANDHKTCLKSVKKVLKTNKVNVKNIDIRVADRNLITKGN